VTSTPSTARSSTEYSWLRRFAARRPLTAFLVLGMSLGYTLAFVWGLAYYGVIPGGGLADALHIAPDELVGAATLIGLFPAALFVTWASDGRAGVRILLRRAVHWRVSPWWWLTVLFGLPILTVGLALMLGDELRPVDISSLVVSQLTLLLVNFVVTNIWEETAWTGVFQTRLEERHNWLVAALLTAIPFAAMHLPLQFFVDQPVSLGSLAAAFGLYLLLGLLVRPLLAVFRRGTGDSILLVALLHSVFNRTNNPIGGAIRKAVGLPAVEAGPSSGA
jgi:CAAX protease family protein